MLAALQFVRSVVPRGAAFVLGIALLGVFLASPLQAAVVITTASPLPGGTVSTQYSLPLAASGCPGSCTWTLVSAASSFPPGLSLSNAGVISGNNPNTAGIFTFTIEARGLLMDTNQKVFTLTIAPALSVTTTSLPGGTVTGAYSQTLTSTGGTAPFTWSNSGSLPGGLSLAASTGVISGTPTAAGTFTFNVSVKDSANLNGATATRNNLSIVVAAAPTITTASLPGGITGIAYSQTVAATGGTGAITWSLAAGAFPTGLNIAAGTGVISGTPSAAGPFAFTVRATDSVGATVTRALSINIAAPLSITTTSLPVGTASSQYSATVASSGGTAPLSWSILPGPQLPAGLNIAAGTGVISGTPTTVGTANFQVQVTDSGSPVQTTSRPLSITINSALNITTSSFPGGTVGALYTTTAVNSGGTAPFAWTISSGNLPAGLSLVQATGVITGTPASAGTTNFTIRVADSVGASATKDLSIVIAVAPAITTTSLPGGTAGAAYSQTILRTGGTAPFVWTVASGLLPAGLNIASSTGIISGTPTAEGTSGFVIRVTDSVGAAALSPGLSIVVASALTVTTTSLPSGTVGIAYATTLTRAGGTSPFTWAIVTGALPGGLTLNTGTGEITGTPTAGGSFNITARTTDGVGATASKDLSIVIATAPVISTSTLPGGTQGTAYSQTIAATGGTAPLNWTVSVGLLPAGLNLNPDTAVISGTPTAAGTSGFTVRVADSVGASAVKQFSIVIAAPLVITTNSLPGGTATAPYSATLASTGGTAPLSWTITAGTLPTGLTLSASTGVISGTPSVTGTSNITVRVSDSGGAAVSQALSIVISPPLTITTTSLPDGTTGVAYSSSLTRTGGTAPFTWAFTTGTLPGGLTLSPTAGSITGTPTATGTFSFTVRVTDAVGATSSKALSVLVASALTITTSTLPSGTAGTAYSATLVASGGTTPHTWSVTVGLLPAGLTLNSSTGAITGTAPTAGTENFLVQVSDNGNPARTTTQPLSITIVPAISISTTSLQDGNAGLAYSQTLTATGGTPPFSWSVVAGSGSLPLGLTLSGNGLLSGTPTFEGTFSFTIRAADSVGSVAATKALSIKINPPQGGSPPLAITSAASLLGGTLGSEYSQSLSAVGGVLPYTWSLATGILPAGLLLNAAGVVSGTPTAAGSVSFTAQVRDSSTPAQTATKTLSLAIIPALAIVTPTLAGGTAGAPYSATLAAAGGTPPYRWSITTGSLPAGIGLNADTGTISGTTIATGTFNIRVTLTDAQALTVSKTFTLVVAFPQIDSNIPATVKPAQQPPLSLTLKSSFPSAITGVLTLTFTPHAAVVNVMSDDPMPQFSNGTRTVNFSIPANTTAVVLSPPVSLLTGTVAGTIRLTANIQSGPAAMLVSSTDILPEAPQITALDGVQSSTGITIRTTGYSDTRSITSVIFNFEVKTSSGNQPVNLTRNVDGDFTKWYQDASSAAFGSTFIFVQSFTVQGDASSVQAVTVTLTNAQGSTVSSRAVLTHQ